MLGPCGNRQHLISPPGKLSLITLCTVYLQEFRLSGGYNKTFSVVIGKKCFCPCVLLEN